MTVPMSPSRRPLLVATATSRRSRDRRPRARGPRFAGCGSPRRR
jgi:hypothetical protein